MTQAGHEIRVRFAPSPTGWLHIGNARTALYNWLFARRFGGRMILRIEDTDVERSSTESESGIFESLRWIGLDWDEGPEVGGNFGPYRQSERLDIYRGYSDILLENGLAYRCFCTPDQLEEQRESALAQGKSPRYSGKCASLGKEEVAARLATSPAAVRFRVPDTEIAIDDLVRGRVIFPAGELGDFVILRSNGLPSYNFAVVADDHAMGITHVIRGEDHLSNTPKQIFLYRALNLSAPRFAHLSMILGPDQTRLSKRHGATSVAQFKDMGYLPDALTNYLALLGWSPGDDREVMDRAELVSAFSLERVSKSASVFDPGKLSWMNGVYLRQTEIGRLFEHTRPFLTRAGIIEPGSGDAHESHIRELLGLVRGNAHFLTDLPELIKPYLERRVVFSHEALPFLKEKSVRELIEKLAALVESSPPRNKEEFVNALKTTGKSVGLTGKGLFMPVRVALTGETHGPDLDRVYLLLGPVKVAERLRDVIEHT